MSLKCSGRFGSPANEIRVAKLDFIVELKDGRSTTLTIVSPNKTIRDYHTISFSSNFPQASAEITKAGIAQSQIDNVYVKTFYMFKGTKLYKDSNGQELSFTL